MDRLSGAGVRMTTEPYTAPIDEIHWSKRPRHRMRCSQSSTIAALGKIECANGAIQFKAYCLECGGKGSDLPHDTVSGLDVSRIPTLTRHERVPCERCGSTDGSEVHHWAPGHLFEDSLEWPTSYLCRACHMRWHSIVTPNMTTRSTAPC